MGCRAVGPGRTVGHRSGGSHPTLQGPLCLCTQAERLSFGSAVTRHSPAGKPPESEPEWESQDLKKEL